MYFSLFERIVVVPPVNIFYDFSIFENPYCSWAVFSVAFAFPHFDICRARIGILRQIMFSTKAGKNFDPFYSPYALVLIFIALSKALASAHIIVCSASAYNNLETTKSFCKGLPSPVPAPHMPRRQSAQAFGRLPQTPSRENSGIYCSSCIHTALWPRQIASALRQDTSADPPASPIR